MSTFDGKGLGNRERDRDEHDRAQTASSQKETRQCDSCRMAAPSSGPTIGATPATPWTRFRDFTNRAPEARSTTTERAITIAHPPLKPWTRRATIITPIDGLSAHTTEAGDHHERAEQRTAATPLVGDRTTDELTERHPDEEGGQRELHLGRAACRSSPTMGNAGTYMSVASGAIIVSSTTFASTALLNRAPRAATASLRSPVDRHRVLYVPQPWLVACFLASLAPARRRPWGSLAREVYRQGTPGWLRPRAVPWSAWTTGPRCASSSPRDAPS